jgi:aerobic-type carbon monoxide dehydrogenase small subunit (CoxS/CutS family)
MIGPFQEEEKIAILLSLLRMKSGIKKGQFGFCCLVVNREGRPSEMNLFFTCKIEGHNIQTLVIDM